MHLVPFSGSEITSKRLFSLFVVFTEGGGSGESANAGATQARTSMIRIFIFLQNVERMHPS